MPHEYEKRFEFELLELYRQGEKIMATIQELTAAVDALKAAQAAEAKRVEDKIAALTAQIGQVDPATQTAIDTATAGVAAVTASLNAEVQG